MAFIQQEMHTYILISFVFGALSTPAVVAISSVLRSFLLLELLLKIGNLGLQGAKLAAVSVESPLTKLSLHVLDHVVDLSSQKNSLEHSAFVNEKGILLKGV